MADALHSRSTVQHFSSFIKQSCTLSKVQYLADTDVFQVTKRMYLIVAETSQSQRTCEAVQMSAFTQHTQDSLPAPVYITVLVNDGVLLATLSIFLVGFCTG